MEQKNQPVPEDIEKLKKQNSELRQKLNLMTFVLIFFIILLGHYLSPAWYLALFVFFIR